MGIASRIRDFFYGPSDPAPVEPRALPPGDPEPITKAAGVTQAPGVPGFSVFGGYLQTAERNAEMVGARKWTRFGEMVRNTPIVGAGLRRYLTLVGSPKVSIPPFKDRKAEAPDEDDVMMAEFAEDQLEHLATDWSTVMMTAAMARWNGTAIQVWTARRLPDGMVGLADITDRPMHTIEQWDIDADGTLRGVVQRGPDGTMYPIERERMVYSRDIPLNDSPAGVGILRQVAEPVRELEALFKQLHQGLETDLGGIPVVYAPIKELSDLINTTVGGRPFTRADFDAAIADLIRFAKNHIRTKETGLVLDSAGHKDINGAPTGPAQYKVELLQAGGKSHDALLEAIKQKLWEIAIITGFEYLLLGADGSGSLAMAQIKTADAYRLVASFLNAYMIVIQRDVLRPLWALNGRDPMRAPRPQWDHAEFADVATVAGNLMQALASAGVTLDRSRPDDLALINWAMSRVGAPTLEADEDDDLAIPPLPQPPGPDMPPEGTGPEGVIEPGEGEPVGKRRRVNFDDLED